MFFRKKLKQPLQQAIDLVHEAHRITSAYLHDHDHIPTEKELLELNILLEAAMMQHSRMRRIQSRMHQRAQGVKDDAG